MHYFKLAPPGFRKVLFVHQEPAAITFKAPEPW